MNLLDLNASQTVREELDSFVDLGFGSNMLICDRHIGRIEGIDN
jgi:hypothetical protein